MESPNSTSTYTTPTCTLNVSTKAKQLSQALGKQPALSGDFVLEIERDDRGESGRTTLAGDLQTLDALHLVVSNYITETIAKFTLPTAAPSDRQPQSPPIVDRAPTQERPEPPMSGLMRNLPGLRNSQSQGAPGSVPDTRSAQSGHGKISKFIGFMSQHDRQNQPPQDLGRSLPQVAASRAGAAHPAQTTKAPYLTGGERSLDHQLHLGDLATPESGEVQVLSAIQLFDLATVLEEYAATKAPSAQTGGAKGTKVHAQSLTAGGVKRVDAESTAASLARLPNLPRPIAEPETESQYYRRRSQSNVLSALPWAAGAAAVVGGTALLFTPGANDYLNAMKEQIGKLKLPSFLTFERVDETKTVATKPTGKQPTNPNPIVGTTPSTTPSVALPKPWQEQTVQPPTTPQTNAATTPTGQPATNNIGLGTLPSPTSTSPVQTATNNNGLTPLISGVDTGTTTTPTTTTPPKTPATGAAKPTAKPPKSSNISLSTQAIPTLQDPIADLKSTQRIKQAAISTPATPAGGGIDPPAVIDPYTPKKVGKAAKTQPATTKPKPQVRPSNTPFIDPAATIEPKSYTPNPNLITQPTSDKPVPPNTMGNASPAPQAAIDRTTQASNGSEQMENPSLKEAQRYFQGKWKATPTQTNVLQYVVDINGKNGLVRSVNPQGEEATNYLKQSKLIKPGQKLVSPVTGNSDQKIRILLHPDGNVDTFIEP
jgi:hypothetical protein